MAFGGSGQSAGLCVGDMLIEVNGQNVEEKYLEDVILLLKEKGHFLSLVVMDKTGYNKLKQIDTPNRDITDSEVKIQKDYIHYIMCLHIYHFISDHNIYHIFLFVSQQEEDNYEITIL